MDPIFISSLWRKQDVRGSSSNANGLLRGIITLWKLNSIEAIFSFKWEDFSD